MSIMMDSDVDVLAEGSIERIVVTRRYIQLLGLVHYSSTVEWNFVVQVSESSCSKRTDRLISVQKT